MRALQLGRTAFSVLLAALAIVLFFMVRPHVDSSLLLPAAGCLGIASGMMLARNAASVLFASVGLFIAVLAIWPELPKPMSPWDNPSDCSGCQEIGYLIGVPVYFGFYALTFAGLIFISLIPFSMHVFFKRGTEAPIGPKSNIIVEPASVEVSGPYKGVARVVGERKEINPDA